MSQAYQGRVLLNEAVEIATGVQYMPISKHRGGATADACAWVVSIPEEIACFLRSHNLGWVNQAIGWGNLPSGSATLATLGVNEAAEQLRIAKFVRRGGPAWHGYPADYRRRAQDRPPTDILLSWNQLGLITKAAAGRIRMGKTCNL